jgi:hypothetical protein
MDIESLGIVNTFKKSNTLPPFEGFNNPKKEITPHFFLLGKVRYNFHSGQPI